MVVIKNGKFFIEGKETDNPELIGLAMIDELESEKNTIDLLQKEHDRLSKKILAIKQTIKLFQNK